MTTAQQVQTAEPDPGIPADETENHKREPLYTIAEVAQYLQVSQDTVYDLMNRGELPYVQIVRRGRRVVPKDLRDFVLRRRIKGKRKAATADGTVR